LRRIANGFTVCELLMLVGVVSFWIVGCVMVYRLLAALTMALRVYAIGGAG